VLICTKEIFKKHVKELLYARYKALFFDECHMGLQSWGMLTKKKQLTTYGAVTHFVEALPHGRLVLSTGTPASNELETAWGVISLKSPELYESKAHFDADHVTYKQIKIKSRFRPGSYMTRSIVDHENYRNLDKLHTSLYHQSVRALKLEVLDIKKPNIQEVDIRLSKPHQAAYTALVKNKVLEFGDKLIDARNASKLRQLCMQGITNPGVLTSKPVGNSVFELVDALLESLDVKHNKVLLFANYRQTVRNLAEHLKRLNPGTVYGENSPAQNSEHVQRFKNTDLCRVLISNPIAGGVGLTLGHVCQAVIVVEPISTPGQFDQALSRTVLSGQKEPVVVYIVRVLGTISPSLTDLMKGKLIRNEEVMQDGQSLVDELLGRR
jgi:SNF2 family DNA or RNA helicase